MKNSDWKYVRRKDIDVARWDQCIQSDRNAPVYALSVYLDYTADNWDGLVLADYEAVMPLPWKRKFGIRYLYAPYFVQHLGLFSSSVDEQMVESAIRILKTKFRWIDYNVDRHFASFPGTTARTNYILALDKPYDDLRSEYSDQCRANLQKAAARNCQFVEDVEIATAIHFFRSAYGHLHRAHSRHYKKFQQLLQVTGHPFMVQVSGVRDTVSGKLLFAGVMIHFKNRVYYALGAPNAEGRTARATYFFIDQFVRAYAGSGFVLDFEGSDLPNVAEFYNRFGPQREEYLHLRINNLPWFLRLLKP